MTSPAASKPTTPPDRPKSTVCAALAGMIITFALTSCASNSSAPKASLPIYQPRILQLQAGVPVQTSAGIYTPAADETWHSPAAFEALEREAVNAAAAAAQKSK